MGGALVRNISSGAVAVAVASAVLGGCVHTVDGAGSGPQASAPMLAGLLVPPAGFPPGYPAATLDAQGAGEAIGDIDGVEAGAAVDPADCAPPPPGPAPVDAVAARGVDPATGAALTVALTRTDTPLSRRRDQIVRCPAFTATAGEVVSRVAMTLPARPPVDAPDSLAVETTIRRSTAPQIVVLTLVAQIDDVRVAVALTDDDPESAPDTAALDALFSDAVVHVRRGMS